jgi:hypothetical protein
VDPGLSCDLPVGLRPGKRMLGVHVVILLQNRSNIGQIKSISLVLYYM